MHIVLILKKFYILRSRRVKYLYHITYFFYALKSLFSLDSKVKIIHFVLIEQEVKNTQKDEETKRISS